MNKKYIALLLIFPLLSVSLFIGKVNAEAPTEKMVEKTEWTVQEVKDLVDYYADMYGVSRQLLHKVVNCESSYNYKAVGDGGKSFGFISASFVDFLGCDESPQQQTRRSSDTQWTLFIDLPVLNGQFTVIPIGALRS